jgi:hypothetical protein
MAILVTSNMTEISDCDTDTGWSAGTLNDAYQLEGTHCLGDKISQTTGTLRTFSFSANQNMTNKFVIMTMMVAGLADTKANGGYRVYIEDSLGAYGYWYVGGKDTHSGGWGYFAVDPSTTPTTANGTIDVSTIAKVGIQMKVLSKALGNATNAFWDICHFGTGLKVTSAGSEAGGNGPNGECAWEDIFKEDAGSNPHYYGIIQKANGVYFIRGKVEFGDAAAALSIDFEDDGSIVVFQEDEFMVNATSEILASANETGTTNIKMPSCFITSSMREFKLTTSDANIDVASFDGATIKGAAASTMSAGNLDGMKFDSCGQIDPGTASLDTTIFSNTSDANGALLLDSSGTANMANLNFISDGTGHAIYITASGTYTFTAFSYSGYGANTTTDAVIYNNSGGNVIINVSGGDTPTYKNGASAATTISASYNHILTGLELNTEVTYVTADTSTELYNVENATVSDGDGKYKTTYTHSGGASVDILIHHINYKPDISNIYGITLPNADTTVKVQLFEDENYYNPI